MGCDLDQLERSEPLGRPRPPPDRFGPRGVAQTTAWPAWTARAGPNHRASGLGRGGGSDRRAADPNHLASGGSDRPSTDLSHPVRLKSEVGRPKVHIGPNRILPT